MGYAGRLKVLQVYCLDRTLPLLMLFYSNVVGENFNCVLCMCFLCYSFHELGIYDIPATIYFILEKTQQDELYYIGHSQGATIGT